MFILRIARSKYYTSLWLVLFYIVLLVCFALVVQNEYAFQKAKLTYELDLPRLVIGGLTVLFNLSILTTFSMKDFHYSVTVLILVFFVLPSAVLFSYVRGYNSHIFLSHNLFFLAVLLIGKIRLKIKSRKVQLRQSERLLALAVLVGLIPFVILFLPYINLNNLLLKDIYETRAFLNTHVNNAYTNYTYSWFNKFIIPCLLVFAIYFRDRLTLLIGSLALIFLYLCGAHKAVFVGLIITFVLYKYDYIRKINYFIKLLVGIGLFSLTAALLFNNDFFMTMSIRRAFLLPAMVDVLYFKMFHDNHMLWSETFNGLFRQYPYDVEHPYVIGREFFSDVSWGANNGIISDGFMNAGLPGVLMNITLVSLYFAILNQLDISPKFFGLFFLFVFLILSGSLTTVMLSHGGFILLILALFFMKNTNEQMA